MIQIIKEEIFTKAERTYLIKVIFDGEDYIASGYVNNILINETRQSKNEFDRQLDAESPEIDNMIHLIKEDIIDTDY